MGCYYFINLFLVGICITTVNSQSDRVKLTDVQILTLQRDSLTTGRRTRKISQLKCIGNIYKCQAYAPSTVQCFNKGFDGFDTQWECSSADLDKRVKFGILKVSCEGYNQPNDPYILAGSCGLEYSLESAKNKNYYDFYNKDMSETNKLSNFITLLIMMIIIIAFYKSCNKNRENDNLRREINNTAYMDLSLGISPSADQSYYANMAFPPPPPPYGFVINTSGTSSSTDSNIPKPVIMPPVDSNQNNNLTNLIDPRTNANIQSTTQTNAGSSAWTSFLTGAGVGGVTGFLLSRRNSTNNQTTSTTTPNLPNTSNRTESPPPCYEDESLSTGFATTTRR